MKKFKHALLAIARMLADEKMLYSAVSLPLSFVFDKYATEFAQIGFILILVHLAALYGVSRR